MKLLQLLEAARARGTLYLVACVAKKASEPLPARELYRSDWFRKARAYVEQTGAPWLILSAEHGLVRPGEVIGPYERTLNTMSAAERSAWGGRVLAKLQAMSIRPTRIALLAGRRYRDPLVPTLRELGIEIDVPMEGLGIGEQLGWLKSRIRAVGAGSAR